MYTLIGLKVSPWSEKARWALDHHRIPYRKVEYLPLFGEPLLRLALRRPSGRVSVPVLFAGTETLTDSLEIARHADRVGQGPPLCPPGLADEVEQWNRAAEQAMGVQRARVLGRTGQSQEALLANLPRWVPAPLGRTSLPLVSLATNYVLRKYGDTPTGPEAGHALLRETLLELRRALGGRPYLLGEFSLADVVMGAALQGIRPVAAHHWPLRSALREVWTEPELSREFGDLLEWRDALYDRHRRPG